MSISIYLSIYASMLAVSRSVPVESHFRQTYIQYLSELGLLDYIYWNLIKLSQHQRALTPVIILSPIATIGPQYCTWFY